MSPKLLADQLRAEILSHVPPAEMAARVASLANLDDRGLIKIFAFGWLKHISGGIEQEIGALEFVERTDTMLEILLPKIVAASECVEDFKGLLANPTMLHGSHLRLFNGWIEVDTLADVKKFDMPFTCRRLMATNGFWLTSSWNAEGEQAPEKLTEVASAVVESLSAFIDANNVTAISFFNDDGASLSYLPLPSESESGIEYVWKLLPPVAA